MLWLLVPLWFLYCVPVAPTWCYVWVPLRSSGHGRLSAWAIASACGLLWFVFWPVHTRLNVRAGQVATVGDQIADEFKTVYG